MRKSKSLKAEAGEPTRKEFQEWFAARPGKLGSSALEDAFVRLHEIILASNSSGAAEYVVSQIIGTPRTTVTYEVGETAVFEAYAEAMAELGFSESAAA